MVISRDNTQTYLWVEKCIYSCKTYDQLDNARNLIKLYRRQVEDRIASKQGPNSCLMFIEMLKMAWKHQEKSIAGPRRGGANIQPFKFFEAYSRNCSIQAFSTIQGFDAHSSFCDI